MLAGGKDAQGMRPPSEDTRSYRAQGVGVGPAVEKK